MVLNETAELLGLSMRMTEDQLTRDMMASSASTYKCEGGSNGDSPTDISLNDIDTVTTALLSNDAWRILDRQLGQNRFGTGPVRNSYVVLCHTDLTKDLNNLNGFISQWNYPNENQALQSEWGNVNNARFFVSSQGSVLPNASANGASVYNLFFQGLESLACVEQDNFSATFLYRPAVFSDALFQNVTLGATFAEVPKILNDLWLTKMQATLR